MYKKKLLALPLIVALLTGVVTGCGNSAPAQSKNAGQAKTKADAEINVSEASAEKTADESAASLEATTSESASAAEATTEDASPSITVKGITERSDEMRDLSAMELVAEMNAGWNLGNTLDAIDGSGLGSETSWGNPKTTKEMIDAVCTKGFDSIRIPITWGNHVGDAPDYTIDPEWMNRVEEVVNYALDDGMFVLIDTHHEEMWRIPDAEHIEAVDAENIAIWKQIAEHFKDYGDHLVFEGLNEPRTKGSANEWSGGTEEERDYVNRLNKSFVDTVRATGGNNEKRLLLVTTYADSAENVAMKQLEIPDDGHIGVAIHAYTPYAFTFANGESYELFTWTGSKNSEIVNLIASLSNHYLSKGIPVLLTEYGAVNKSENTEDVAKWATAYVKRATSAGVPCFWWDNGIYDQDGEKFAIFDRKNLSWYREEVVDAIIAESYAK